jgi:soluble lytic murein transglycosylase-like protein
MGEQRTNQPEQVKMEANRGASIRNMSPEVRSIDAFLERHGVRKANRSRLADSIVTSARKYNLSPRLIASIMIIESRGNPFAISGKNAVGVMQIHVPTWGDTADREGINLLKIEDNVDFGTRILNDYIRRFGLWEGVKRYNGFFVANPVSEQSALDYVAKVQRVYEFQPTAASQPDIS